MVETLVKGFIVKLLKTHAYAKLKIHGLDFPLLFFYP